MKVTAITHKTTGERALRVNGSILPLGIAALCTDHRISGFRVECTECRVELPVRDLNAAGWCEDCADFDN
jgi:hypothetical protein